MSIRSIRNLPYTLCYQDSTVNTLFKSKGSTPNIFHNKYVGETRGRFTTSVAITITRNTKNPHNHSVFPQIDSA